MSARSPDLDPTTKGERPFFTFLPGLPLPKLHLELLHSPEFTFAEHGSAARRFRLSVLALETPARV
jgi:hypothetical protein